ncbi:MAG: dihydrofolate reductase family protein [Aeromicrobium erythreum]
MTRYVYFTATTLDGFLADEHDSLDWLLSQDIDPDGPFGHEAFAAQVGALVMGATTYRWVVDHLAESGEAWPYEQPTFVFTHGSPEPAAPTVRVVQGRPAEHRRAIEEAAGGRDVWVMGGGDLAGQCAEDGMLDEAMVAIAPVTLGAGAPLLPRRLDLSLREVQRNRAFACLHYDVVGLREEAREK